MRTTYRTRRRSSIRLSALAIASVLAVSLVSAPVSLAAPSVGVGASKTTPAAGPSSTVVTSTASVPATPTAPGIAEQLAETRKEMALTTSSVANARLAVEKLNILFELAVEDYDKADEQYQQAEADLTQTRQRLDQATQELDFLQGVLGAQVRDTYRRGDLPLWTVLLGANDFADMVGRVRFMTALADRDAAVVAEVSGAREELDSLRASQSQLARQREAMLLVRGEAKAQVEARLAEQNAYVAQLKAYYARLAASETQLSAQYAAQLQAQQQATLGFQPGIALSADWTPPPGGRPEVVRVALRYLGVPYVWGGETPSGFDCSGLMQWSFRQLGIEIPRVSRDQYQVGMPVARDQLLPGDLVFFSWDGTPSGVHHVAMYIGDGKMVEAKQSGTNVMISPLRERHYIGARRI